MPAGFSEREKEAIRRRLRAAALDALARGGLAAASVADLARAADIAKGSFYSFYPAKEHLFLEALESIEDEYRARFAAAAVGPELLPGAWSEPSRPPSRWQPPNRRSGTWT